MKILFYVLSLCMHLCVAQSNCPNSMDELKFGNSPIIETECTLPGNKDSLEILLREYKHYPSGDTIVVIGYILSDTKIDTNVSIWPDVVRTRHFVKKNVIIGIKEQCF